MNSAAISPLPEGVQRVAAELQRLGHPQSPVMLDDAARTAQQAADALGVALGNPGRRVISINGDGGFGWGLQELATAAKYRANLAIVVFADGAFGNVRRIQNNVFQRETDTTLHNPDYGQLAAAFGVAGERVDSPDGLAAALERAFAAGGPHLIEVRVGAMQGPWHLIHTFSKAPRPAPANPLGEPAPAGAAA